MTSMAGNTGMQGRTGTISGQKLSATGSPKKTTGGYKVDQMQNYSPEQMDLFRQMFSNVSPDSYTSRLAGGDQSLFDEMEAPALRQFSALQGSTASRFSGMGGKGSLGSRRSSGFQNEMNQASSDFAQDLQSRRQGLMRQAIQDLMGMSGDLLNAQPYDNQRMEPQQKQPWWKKLLGGALPIAGGVAGGFFGGPAGAMAGFQAGNAAGSAFTGGGNQQADFSGIGSMPTSWGNQGSQLRGSNVRAGVGAY